MGNLLFNLYLRLKRVLAGHDPSQRPAILFFCLPEKYFAGLICMSQ